MLNYVYFLLKKQNKICPVTSITLKYFIWLPWKQILKTYLVLIKIRKIILVATRKHQKNLISL